MDRMKDKLLEGWVGAEKFLRKWEDQKGQNTVEYLIMLVMIAAVVGVVGLALKKYVPDLLGIIQSKVTATANQN